MSVKNLYEGAENILTKFGTDLILGLTDEQVLQNRNQYGSNCLTPPKKDPIWKQYLEKFTDPTIIILCVCAVLAIGIGIYRNAVPWDGVAILIAVGLATAGGTWSEYKADKAFELLKKDSDNIPVKVTRNGLFHTITSNDLVVGDLIHIEGGDKIPADSVLLKSVDLMIDESLMTGESVPVHKGPNDINLIAGTHAVIGNGFAVVHTVGDKTELGNLASSLSKPFVCPDKEHQKIYREPGKCEVPNCGKELTELKEGETPLQKRLAGLADQISIWGTYTAVFIFLALLAAAVFSGKLGAISATWKTNLSYFMGSTILVGVILLLLRKEKLTKVVLKGMTGIIGIALLLWAALHSAGQWLDTVKLILDYFMVAVTIVVVAVPEGLPMAVFIALGLGMRKIREDNNLVRKMVATETIGSATVICTDKTGTLTKNQMEVAEVFITGKHLKGQDVFSVKNIPGYNLLSLGCALNSTAEVEHLDHQIRFVGNPTEGALLYWLEKQGTNYHELRMQMPVHNRVCFTADRKMMTSIIGNDACSECVACALSDVGVDISSVSTDKDGCRMIFSKGAPEKILPLCKKVYISENKQIPISQYQDEIQDVIDKMAYSAIRPLAISYRIQRGGTSTHVSSAESSEKDLVLLAIVGMTDPMREDVPDAIRICNEAGIDVKMITGDYAPTAQSIARQIGMLDEDDISLDGEELSKKSDNQVLNILQKLRIVSRARPRDKERLVSLLQQSGHVVAVTGDGTNDAPALKKADVGISMGLKGTDVAKEASDIVLTDDNFGSIVRAIHWGRTLYENLQKFLQFQLTVNLSALGVAFISPIVATIFPKANFQVQPLTVLQYLWINLIMDTLAAIAFGLEPPRPEVMKQKPKKSSEPFLTKTMISNILVLGVYFIILIFLIQAFDILGLGKFQHIISKDQFQLMSVSVVFNCYVWFQIFHMFNARSVMSGRSAFANIFKSRSFFFVMGFVILMQIVLVQFGGKVLNTSPLPFLVWIRIILLGMSAIFIGEILRFIQRVIFKSHAYGLKS